MCDRGGDSSECSLHGDTETACTKADDGIRCHASWERREGREERWVGEPGLTGGAVCARGRAPAVACRGTGRPGRRRNGVGGMAGKRRQRKGIDKRRWKCHHGAVHCKLAARATRHADSQSLRVILAVSPQSADSSFTDGGPQNQPTWRAWWQWTRQDATSKHTADLSACSRLAARPPARPPACLPARVPCRVPLRQSHLHEAQEG